MLSFARPASPVGPFYQYAKSQMGYPAVAHCKKERFDVYIGRPSKWGNPFIIGKDGDRAEVVKKYREWILNQPELMASLPELTGMVLACWCAPLACHGDVLLELANKNG